MTCTAVPTSRVSPRGFESSTTTVHRNLLQVLTLVLASDSIREAATAMANHAAVMLGDVHVAVATCRRDPMCRLQAISGMAGFDRRSERIRFLEEALDEAALATDTIVYDRRDLENGSARTHIQLANQLNCRWIVSSPLIGTDGRRLGAWLVWGDSDHGKSAASAWLLATGPLLAVALDTVRRASWGPFQGLRRRIARHGPSQIKRWAIGLTGAALAGLLLFPWTYSVDCGCTVEPVHRRYVAAPFDAPLTKAHVHPGNRVRAGDPLADLDGREIRLELAALDAEYRQASQARAMALAERKPADAQLARLEMEQVKNQIDLLERRRDQLQVASPIDGMVMSGDLQRAVGAPLVTGQTLFEIAPLERMVLEIAVPERDIAYVSVGTPVTIRLDALPGTSRTGIIQRIRPKADLRDRQSVFVAEVELANSDTAMRPGMQGTARIAGPRSTLGWILFHRPFEAFVRWLRW